MERDDVDPDVIVISAPTVKFPIVGGGQIVVANLKPGERRKVTILGRDLIVYRQYVH